MAAVRARRLVALLLVLAPLVPAARVLAGPPADPHACTDHVCYCASRASRPASRACHEGATAREATMSGACRHGGSGAHFTLGQPEVLPDPVVVRVPDPEGQPPLIAVSAVAPGFRKLDTPPPRRA
jgi:hypothetical protein